MSGLTKAQLQEELRQWKQAADWNGSGIMEARHYIYEHLGIREAFFDDVIHNAVARALRPHFEPRDWSGDAP